MIEARPPAEGVALALLDTAELHEGDPVQAWAWEEPPPRTLNTEAACHPERSAP